MNYKKLDTDINPYIEKLKNFKILETNQLNIFLKEFKEVALNIYSDIFNIVAKKKEKESNMIERIKILYPQITELNSILKTLNSNCENEDIMEVLGVTIPIEDSIGNLIKAHG